MMKSMELGARCKSVEQKNCSLTHMSAVKDLRGILGKSVEQKNCPLTLAMANMDQIEELVAKI